MITIQEVRFSLRTKVAVRGREEVGKWACKATDDPSQTTRVAEREESPQRLLTTTYYMRMYIT